MDRDELIKAVLTGFVQNGITPEDFDDEDVEKVNLCARRVARACIILADAVLTELGE